MFFSLFCVTLILNIKQQKEHQNSFSLLLKMKMNGKKIPEKQKCTILKYNNKSRLIFLTFLPHLVTSSFYHPNNSPLSHDNQNHMLPLRHVNPAKHIFFNCCTGNTCNMLGGQLYPPPSVYMSSQEHMIGQRRCN